MWKEKNALASTVKLVESELKTHKKYSPQPMGNIQNLFLSLEWQASVKHCFVKSWSEIEPWDQEIVTTDFNSSGPLLVSNPLTQSLKQVSFLGKSLFV